MKLGAPQSAVIISGDHNDEKRFWEYTDGSKHKKQIEDFKKPLGSGEGESDLSILIVKDMLLTGFDAPVAQVMYLDRKLHGPHAAAGDCASQQNKQEQVSGLHS